MEVIHFKSKFLVYNNNNVKIKKNCYVPVDLIDTNLYKYMY